MPKVNIYPPKLKIGADARRLSIGWQPGKDAQVAVLKRHLDAAQGDDEVTASGQTVWLGEWVDLDRDAINEAIRTLIKARDEAYGRDASGEGPLNQYTAAVKAAELLRESENCESAERRQHLAALARDWINLSQSLHG